MAVAVPHYRFKIIETHHAEKKDAPSGTALSLRQVVQTANPSINVEIESKRLKAMLPECIFWKLERKTKRLN